MNGTALLPYFDHAASPAIRVPTLHAKGDTNPGTKPQRKWWSGGGRVLLNLSVGLSLRAMWAVRPRMLEGMRR